MEKEKKDTSLEDILGEFEHKSKHSRPTDAKLDEILTKHSDTEQPAPRIPEAEEADDTPPPVVKKTKRPKTVNAQGKKLKLDPYGNPVRKKKQNTSLRRPTPANEIKPADIKKPEVSFMNSVAAIEAAQKAMPPSHEKSYDTVVMPKLRADEYQPNIRKMSDSTRAKELQSKKRFGRHKQPEFTYERETPGAKPLRRREVPEAEEPAEARRPKTRFIIEDLQDAPTIPSPFLETQYEPEEPVDYVKTAKQTSIDLSAENRHEPDELDVKVPRERKPLPGKPKRVRDMETKEDIQAIRTEIAELSASIAFRLMALLVLTICSMYLAFASDYGLPLPSGMSVGAAPKTYAALQLLIGAAGALCSISAIFNGCRKFMQLHADCDSMSALSILSALLAGGLAALHPEMLQNQIVHIYIPVALLALLGNTTGKLLIALRAARNFRLVSGSFDRYAIFCVEHEKRAEDLTRGTLGDFPILAGMRKTDTLCDFLRYTFSSDVADKFCRVAAPVALVVSLILSISLSMLRAASVGNALCFGTSVFAVCFAACACIPVTIITNLPLARAAQKFTRNKGVMLGYQSVDDFYDVNSVMVDAAKLFPEGTINLSAIKIFSDTKIDDAILDAASLTQHANSILQGLFRDAIEGKANMLRTVENFAYEESMGLCGWINNKRVLFGNREMMTSHNIEGIPPRSKEKEFTAGGKDAVYLSVSGNLAAMFVVDIQASSAIRYWLHALEREGICLLIKSNDALLSLRRIAELFDVSEEFIKVLPTRMHPDYDAETAPRPRVSASMACAGRFSSLVQLLLGARSIRASATTGVILLAASCCLGIIIVAAYLFMQAYAQLSASMMLIYQLIWTGVTVLMGQWRRL